MLNFILIYIFIVGVFLLERPLKLHEGKRTLWFVILPVAIVSSTLVGLRPLTAGFDTIKYVTYYNFLQYDTFSTFMDVYSYNWKGDYIYRFWNFALSWLGVSPQHFLYITASVSIFLFILSLRKLVGKDYLLIFLFFYATPGFVQLFANAIRQGFSLAFFLFAIAYYYEQRKIKLFLSVAVTLFLHNSTGIVLIMCLLMISLFSKLIKKHNKFVFVFLLLLQPLMYFFVDLINRFYPSVYTLYESSEYFFHYSFITFLFLYIFYKIRFKLRSKKGEFLFTTYIIITILTSLFWFNPTTFGRIVYLSFPFLALYINNLKYLYEQHWIALLLIVIMFGIGVYFFNTEATRNMLNL
ncbi:EpsG family protein [Sinomicrobium kalidii]|uniref:EpsG family protein n=1 Tax=Sinomicrobium kalidii TaxID=2900738 RepID=UPI001E48A8BE|nr:EpsG family protein [Sinomicrobium kalidii]UGU14374.1 EpsG family protein [Sinomicrobium kalidii]